MEIKGIRNENIICECSMPDTTCRKCRNRFIDRIKVLEKILKANNIELPKEPYHGCVEAYCSYCSQKEKPNVHRE